METEKIHPGPGKLIIKIVTESDFINGEVLPKIDYDYAIILESSWNYKNIKKNGIIIIRRDKIDEVSENIYIMSGLDVIGYIDLEVDKNTLIAPSVFKKDRDKIDPTTELEAFGEFKSNGIL
jgi:hypothetical protein